MRMTTRSHRPGPAGRDGRRTTSQMRQNSCTRRLTLPERDLSLALCAGPRRYGLPTPPRPASRTRPRERRGPNRRAAPHLSMRASSHPASRSSLSITLSPSLPLSLPHLSMRASSHPASRSACAPETRAPGRQRGGPAGRGRRRPAVAGSGGAARAGAHLLAGGGVVGVGDRVAPARVAEAVPCGGVGHGERGPPVGPSWGDGYGQGRRRAN